MDKRLQKIEKSLKSISKSIVGMTARMATKDDLKGFATKDDLKGFATKDDLKRFATKDDLNKAISNLPTRDEMNTAISTAVCNLPTRDEMNTSIENAVDDFARTVAVGFASVDKRFDEFDKKFTEKLDNLEQKVDRNHIGMSKQIEYFSQNYTTRAMHEGLDLRVKRLEKVC